jgi:NAD(P)-dependent dehydrogenase (short-subunit alcohol dehydrogenase family)
MTKSQAKIALVTGFSKGEATPTSRGLGKSTALSLAKAGVDVIVTYHSNAAEATKVVAEIESLGAKAIALQLDASNTKTFDSFGLQVQQSLQSIWETEHIDFLINNAGTGVYAPFSETTEDEFVRAASA